MGHRVVSNATAEVAIDLVREMVSAHGSPISFLTDHGIQFTTMHKDGEHCFDKALAELGIKHIMGRVKHPQTQGKIERSHGSAIAEMESIWGRKPVTIEEYREAIGLWVDFYNICRAHQSLDYKTPLEVFIEERLSKDDPEWLEAVKKEFPDCSRYC